MVGKATQFLIQRTGAMALARFPDACDKGFVFMFDITELHLK